MTPAFEGYAGKDRMVKKTQTVGRSPKPYPGTADDFMAEFCGLVEDVNHQPFTSGPYQGRSGMDVLAEKAAAGWRPTWASPLAIDAAFCERTQLAIQRGAVRYKGVRYTHPRLSAVVTPKVTVMLPWRRGAGPVFEVDGEWFYLEPDSPFRADAIEGAHVSAARQRERNRAVAALERDGPVIDAVAVRLRRQGRRPMLQLHSASDPLDLGGRLAALTARRGEAEAARVAELTEEQRAKLIQQRETEALLREDAADAA